MNHSHDTTAFDEEALLVQAADEFTDDSRRGEQPEIEDFAQRYPTIADTIRRVFPAIASLHQTPTPAPAIPNVMDEPLGDFQVIEELGRGGMGIVYRANEVSLDREVALKVLPLAGMFNDQTLSRFKNEARAAASLSHPHIVPVYSVGEERGVHYYVMRLIHGKSMAELIDEMRCSQDTRPRDDTTAIASNPQHDTRSDADDTRPIAEPAFIDSYGSPLFFRRVATWGAEAARALAHAHAHGVLHRDIKPANLMIDRRGHLWVTDFGLARLDGDVAISVSGDLMGTFRYMSPEQALGRRILIDRRSDVYSLAVTLYELLTLRPVFSSENTLELLRQIAFENPLAPRKLNRSIPIELETILMKGMEKDPERRYGSAEEFADDLQRYLENRPVRAKPPTWLELATKWSLRHQAAVWASIAIVGVAIATLTISTLIIARAYTVATQQRLRAETNLRLAREVIDANYAKEIEALKHEPGMTQQQRRSILKLVQFYEQLPEEDLADPLLRHDACQARLNLADIYLVLGQPRQAIDAYREVIAQAEQLLEGQPTHADFRHTLTMAHNGLGQAQYAIQSYADSIKAHRRALTLAQHLRQAYPNQVEFQRLAICRFHLARAHRDSHVKERTLRTAINTLDELSRTFPDEKFFESYLGRAQDELGLLLRSTGRFSDAESQLRKSIDVHDRLANTRPQLPSHRYELAKAKSHLALLLTDLRRLADAELAHQEAVTLLRSLTEDYPHRVLFRRELAKAHHDLGTLLSSDHRHSDAADSLREAITLLERLTVDAPEAPKYRADLASNYKDLGAVMVRIGDGTSARELLGKATNIWKALEREFPNDPDYQKNLAIVNTYASRFLEIDDRLAAYERTVDVLSDLAERYPERIEYRQLMIQFISGLGNELHAIGKLAEAEDQFLRAIRIADALSKMNPELPLYHEAAGQFAAFGNLSRQLGKYEQSAKAHQTAVQNYRILRQLFPDKREYRLGLCSNLKRLGYAHSRAGHFDDALESYQESIRLALDLSRDYPQEAEFIGKLSRRYQLLGVLQLGAGNVDLAEQAFRDQWQARSRLLADFPRYRLSGIPNWQLLAMLANIVVHQDPSRWPDAVGHLNRAISLYESAGDLPTSLRLELLLADVYRAHGQLANVRQTIDQAIDRLAKLEATTVESKRGPQLSIHSSRWLVALALHRSGETVRADRFYEQVMAQELKDAMWKSIHTWYLVNWPDIEQDEWHLALKLADEAVQARPEHPLHWTMLGIAQYRHGQHSAALDSLTKSLDSSSNGNILAQLYLALAQSRAGDLDTAIDSARQLESQILLADPFNISTYRLLLDEINELVEASKSD